MKVFLTRRFLYAGEEMGRHPYYGEMADGSTRPPGSKREMWNYLFAARLLLIYSDDCVSLFPICLVAVR